MDANHALIPLEHLIELESCAYSTPTSTKSRILGTLQLASFFGGCASLLWAYYKAQTEIDNNKHENAMAEIDAKFHPKQ